MSDIGRISPELHWTKQIISSSIHGRFISNSLLLSPWYKQMILVTRLLITATVTLTTNQLPPALRAKNRAAQRFLCARESSVSSRLKKHIWCRAYSRITGTEHLQFLSTSLKGFGSLWICYLSILLYYIHHICYTRIWILYYTMLRIKIKFGDWFKVDNIDYQRTNLTY